MDRIDRMEMVEPIERPDNGVSKAEYYIQQLNVNNAKKVALCLVLGFICYHGLIHLRYGKYGQCPMLLPRSECYILHLYLKF